eukprot:TRINITY_DN2819_c0_g1_i13.p1 TRINITY_DN2819_c0_g1~~TRINITY_DN2819_c0_g1_i13.p1  ORF type:complete len:269 (-),score=0.91 TRINITY_DN2819_c0_g1_i13:554-1360(-)
MGSTFILEIEDSGIEQCVFKGAADPSLDCEIAFEYRSPEKNFGSSGTELEEATPDRYFRTTDKEQPKIIREVVFRKEGLMIIEDLSLNIQNTDCTPFITGFYVQRDGQEVSLETCRKNNIKCYYNNKKAVIMADCGGSLPNDTVVRLEIAKNRESPLRQLMSHDRSRLLLGVSFDADIEYLKGGKCMAYLLRDIKITVLKPLPIGTYIVIRSNSLFTFIKDTTGLDDFIVHSNTPSGFEIETKRIYSDTIVIPNRPLTRATHSHTNLR